MKSSQILTLVLRLFVAILLGWAGFHKLRSGEADIKLFTSLGMEPHGRHLIGGVEIAAAILVLLPQCVVFGAILSWGLMAGAVLAHLTKLGVSGHAGVHFAAALAALISSSLIIYLNRSHIKFIKHMFDSTAPTSDDPS